MLLVVSKLLSLLFFFVELNLHLLIVIPDYCKCKQGSHRPQTLPPVLPPGGYFKHMPFSCRYMRRDIIYFIYLFINSSIEFNTSITQIQGSQQQQYKPEKE